MTANVQALTCFTGQVYKFNVPTFGKDVVFDVSHKVRAEQFKMFSEGLKISKMTDYVPLFVKEAEVRIKFWTLSNSSTL